MNAVERGRASVEANSRFPMSETESDLTDRVVDAVIDVLMFAHHAGLEVDAIWCRVAQHTHEIGIEQ